MYRGGLLLVGMEMIVSGREILYRNKVLIVCKLHVSCNVKQRTQRSRIFGYELLRAFPTQCCEYYSLFKPLWLSLSVKETMQSYCNSTQLTWLCLTILISLEYAGHFRPTSSTLDRLWSLSLTCPCNIAFISVYRGHHVLFQMICGP